MRSNSLTTALCACVGLQLALHSIAVVGEGSLAVVHILPVAAADTPVVDTLEAVSAALQIRIVAAHADHEVCHALLLVAVQAVVLLLVVRMAVPGCSYVSPSLKRVPIVAKSTPLRVRLLSASDGRTMRANTIIVPFSQCLPRKPCASFERFACMRMPQVYRKKEGKSCYFWFTATFVIQAFEESHYYILLSFSSESVQEQDG